MYEWLTNYGVKQHAVKYEEVDVNDRTMLQDQINEARRDWHQLLVLLDDIQGKYIEVSREIANLVKRLTEESMKENTRLNSLLATNDEYIALEAQQKALAAGISMVREQMDFSKNDLKILNSVFYQKF